MVNAIEVYIPTSSNTLRADLSIFLPDTRDIRVLNREYRLRNITQSVGGGICEKPILVASIKCHSKDDVLIVLNNLETIVKNNLSKIGQGAYLAIHYCGQVEDGVPTTECYLEKVWSN